jgi:hypothetical protein
MARENRGSRDVVQQALNSGGDYHRHSRQKGVTSPGLKYYSTRGLQSNVSPQVVDPLVHMMMSNVSQRVGTANFKSKVVRKTFENPAFIGLCSGPNPPIGSYKA